MNAHPPFLCIGHRGAAGHAPENTLASVRKALELGCTWIEIDVYYVDGEIVMMHDDRLDRTTNGSGLIWEKSFDYLRALDAGQGEQIPTLREVFALVEGRAGINVELKGPHTALPVANLINEFIARGLDKELVRVSSFNSKELRIFRNVLPYIKTGALLIGLPEDNALFAQKLGAYSVNLSIEFIDEEFVRDAHDRNLKVYVFTVNEPGDIVRMKALGVDGIFTDFPERAI